MVFERVDAGGGWAYETAIDMGDDREPGIVYEGIQIDSPC
jgi:hypothetical protein